MDQPYIQSGMPGRQPEIQPPAPEQPNIPQRPEIRPATPEPDVPKHPEPAPGQPQKPERPTKIPPKEGAIDDIC